ncbi:hypothetical protein [Falsiporphyromonas endometrii]|uniref:Lipoprotein n=1 Tax=Falsiporphyromonas endometrii TaxID=1387297 RepID=A0ABV9K807_9PORP
MKKFIFTLLAFAAVAIFAISCASDDDTQPRPESIPSSFNSTASLKAPVLGMTNLSLDMKITKENFPEYKEKMPMINGWISDIINNTNSAPNSISFDGLPDGVKLSDIKFYINKSGNRNDGVFTCQNVTENGLVRMDQRDQFYKKILSLLVNSNDVRLTVEMTSNKDEIRSGNLIMEISATFFTKESR